MAKTPTRSVVQKTDTPTDQPRRAAIYLRISQDRENTRLGVDRHRKAAEQRIKDRGWTFVDVYEDNDTTGSGRKPRPQFERMLADIDKGLIDVVIAQEWPRLERNRADGVRIIEASQKHRVTLSFIKGSDIDCTTSGGRIAADVLSAVARNEIEAKAERQSLAQAQRAELGRPPKGTRPLGYAIDGSVIEHEADAVRAIYKAFAQKASLYSIAAALSGMEPSAKAKGDPDVLKDIPHLPRHMRTLAIERNERRAAEGLKLRDVPDDGPWSPSTVLGILRNPRYAGFSTYTPKEVQADGNKRRSWRASILLNAVGEPIRGQWDAIVDDATWETVQEILDDPRRVTNRVGTHRRHLGSGLFLCGVCGHPVRGSSTRYYCKEPRHVNRSKAPIDDMVTRAVLARLADPALTAKVESDHAPELAQIQADIAEQYARIEKAQRQFDEDEIEPADLKRKRDKARAIIEQLDAKRLTLLSDTGVVPILGTDDPGQSFLDADLGAKRAVIELLCSVTLMPHPQGKKGFDPATVDIVFRG